MEAARRVIVGTNMASKQGTSPPKLKKRETKTEGRMFRFTPSNRAQLDVLSSRYGGKERGCDVSKVMDIMLEASKEPEFLKFFDKYIQEHYSS